MDFVLRIFLIFLTLFFTSFTVNATPLQVALSWAKLQARMTDFLFSNNGCDERAAPRWGVQRGWPCPPRRSQGDGNGDGWWMVGWWKFPLPVVFCRFIMEDVWFGCFCSIYRCFWMWFLICTQGRTDLNGSLGSIVEWDAAEERWKADSCEKKRGNGVGRVGGQTRSKMFL